MKPFNWNRHVSKRWKNKEFLPIVEILWMDACSLGDEWVEAFDNKAMRTVSVGYLVAEDENITLVSTVNEFHAATGITIPTSCIVEKRVLG